MAEPPSKNPTSFSQIPSRPSNPRNTEVNNPIRRSSCGSTFTKPSIITSQRPGFNPNTPANSPAGLFLFFLFCFFSVWLMRNWKKLRDGEKNLMGIRF